ncbi:GNAT family N-acetyltransferase [Aliikangiella marina]|uniref:GNAT family N-acetyltransferase n=1 Tax=Aliikangiella marina TaxID=1712262 RepID=A0A545TDE0_9GAMM|nr:GNAT family N-acetyltransferase [Aliikangiella marina]TQV75230.1 GNAT family N-acetyltransferase [Aliikangiella marina]
MQILQANLSDAAEILKLQRAAYQSEAELHNDFDIPPLTQSLSELEQEFARKKVIKIIDNEKLIASGQVHLEGETCYIGRMAVWPELQGQGIGSKLLSALESFFPEAKRIELFTGENSKSNIAMYQRRGYQIFKESLLGKTKVLFFERILT